MNHKSKKPAKVPSACGYMCKPWKYGMVPLVDEMRASDRRRKEAADASARA